jgi:cytochrome b subunit of formate dehydrogenase
MSPIGIRRAIHHIYTLMAIVLLATGALLAWPDLRAQVLGGYGRETLDVHLWAGWIMLGVPALVLLAAGPIWRDLVRRLGPPDGITWRKINIVLSLAAGVLLAVTGVLLWLDFGIPLAALDASLFVHDALSWLILGALVVHIIAAWRKTVARTREIFGLESEPAFPFEFDDDPEEGDS